MHYLFQDAEVFVTTAALFESNPCDGHWEILAQYGSFDDFMEHIKGLFRDRDDEMSFMFPDACHMHIDGEPTIPQIKQWYDNFNYENYNDTIDEDVARELVDSHYAEWDNFSDYCKDHTFKVYDNLYDLGYDLVMDALPSWVSSYFNFEKYAEDYIEGLEYVQDGDKIILID